MINCNGHDQNNDPFFSGQVDWAVWERNVAYGAKAGDGHGIYLSNGGDWNIVRFNETFGNVSSDFQINADPEFHLQGGRHRLTTIRAATPMPAPAKAARARATISSSTATIFHHSLGTVGPNFTSVRRSVDPQQYLRPAGAPQRELLAGDRQPEARLERQQDRPQPVHHHTPATA